MTNSTKKSGRLSERETDVLKLLIKGLSNDDIAKVLNISVQTVKLHITNSAQKLSIPNNPNEKHVFRLRVALKFIERIKKQNAIYG